jgi:hypothetical protein
MKAVRISEMDPVHSRRKRWTALVAGMGLIAGATVVGAPPAAALPGLTRAFSSSATDSVSSKTVIAACPAGLRVVGGGGKVFATAVADSAKVVLTRLEPMHSGNLDSYVVTGEEIAPGMAGNWLVAAWALCASAPAGYEIVSGSTAPSSSTAQQTAAVCPGTKRVVGTGARINNPAGQVTLQLARSSGPRDISRVTAKEDANRYAATWNVTAYAICTNPLPSFVAATNGSTLTSDNEKVVFVTCPPGTFVHNVAAAISGEPPGLATGPAGVAIQTLFPLDGLRVAQVSAIETTPTNANWDLLAQAICGP